MTQLYRDTRRDRRLSLCDTERPCIAARLAAIGVQYDHVALPAVSLDTMAQPDEIIGAYIEPLDRLAARWPKVAMEVTQVLPAHPRIAGVDRELMTEHAHDVDEAQVLISGAGTLFMRAGPDVFALACEAGDFVRLPAGLGHWFGMDMRVGFRTIRLFEHRERPRERYRGSDMRGLYELGDPSAPGRSAPA